MYPIHKPRHTHMQSHIHVHARTSGVWFDWHEINLFPSNYSTTAHWGKGTRRGTRECASVCVCVLFCSSAISSASHCTHGEQCVVGEICFQLVICFRASKRQTTDPNPNRERSYIWGRDGVCFFTEWLLVIFFFQSSFPSVNVFHAGWKGTRTRAFVPADGMGILGKSLTTDREFFCFEFLGNFSPSRFTRERKTERDTKENQGRERRKVSSQMF